MSSAASFSALRSPVSSARRQAAQRPLHDPDASPQPARNLGQSGLRAAVLGGRSSSECEPWLMIPPRCATSSSTTPPITARTSCNCGSCSPGLGDGLLTAEGEAWRVAAPRAGAAVLAARGHGLRRRDAEGRRRSGRAPHAPPRWRGVEVGEVMARVTLEVLEQTLFSQGLGREPSAFQHAVTRYLDTFGRLDPLDLSARQPSCRDLADGAAAEALRFFDEAVEAIVERRRALIEEGASRRATCSPCCSRREIPRPAAACRRPAFAPISSPSSTPATRRPRMR